MIMKELEPVLEKNVTTITADLKLSTLKPIHATVMTNIYNHLQEQDAKL